MSDHLISTPNPTTPTSASAPTVPRPTSRSQSAADVGCHREGIIEPLRIDADVGTEISSDRADGHGLTSTREMDREFARGSEPNPHFASESAQVYLEPHVLASPGVIRDQLGNVPSAGEGVRTRNTNVPRLSTLNPGGVRLQPLTGEGGRTVPTEVSGAHVHPTDATTRRVRTHPIPVYATPRQVVQATTPWQQCDVLETCPSLPQLRYKVPSNLPSFRDYRLDSHPGYSDVFAFLQKFEDTMLAHGCPEAAWSRIVILCAEGHDADFVRANVVGLPWNRARELIHSHFADPLQHGLILQEFYRLSRGKNEPVLSFCDKYSALLSRANLDPHDPATVVHFISAVCALDSQMAMQLDTASLSQPGQRFPSVQSAMTVALSLERAYTRSLRHGNASMSTDPDLKHQRRKGLSARAPSHRANRVSFSSRGGIAAGAARHNVDGNSRYAGRATNKYCSFHKSSSHNTAECRAAKNNGNPGRSSTQPRNKGDGCFNCGSKDHWASQCPSRSQSRRKNFGNVSAVHVAPPSTVSEEEVSFSSANDDGHEPTIDIDHGDTFSAEALVTSSSPSTDDEPDDNGRRISVQDLFDAAQQFEQEWPTLQESHQVFKVDVVPPQPDEVLASDPTTWPNAASKPVRSPLKIADQSPSDEPNRAVTSAVKRPTSQVSSVELEELQPIKKLKRRKPGCHSRKSGKAPARSKYRARTRPAQTYPSLVEHARKFGVKRAREPITIAIQVGVDADHLTPVMAMIDTGASLSCISPACAEALSLEVDSVTDDTYLTLADSSRIPRVGTTQETVVKYGEREFTTRFEVMNISTTHSDFGVGILLGRDLLFSHLGLEIRGLQPLFNIKVQEHAIEERPAQPITSLAAIETSSVRTRVAEIPPIPEEDRNRLLEAIKKVVAANAAIHATSRCNIPESEVRYETGDATPVFVRQYPISKENEAVVDKQVEAWLNDEMIEMAAPGTLWNFPLVVVKRVLPDKTVKYRVCVDLRRLNEVLEIDDHFTLPLIDDILAVVGESGAEVYTVIDLAQCFNQFGVYRPHRGKCSFTWRNKHYSFSCAVFGDASMPSRAQRVIQSALAGCESFARNYLDDVVVFSRNMDEHIEHVRTVIAALTDANLRLRPEKCEFGLNRVVLLGHVITPQGIYIDEDRLSSLKSLPEPKTPKQVMSVMGSFNFFRKMVPMFSTIARPLDVLRSVKPSKFVFTQEARDAFNTLKKLLCARVILSHPDFSHPFVVAVDAAQTGGLGAILLQFVDNEMRIVACQARSLTPSERLYSATKLELAAIVFAIRRFRMFLYGRKFTLYCDHASHQYLLTGRRRGHMVDNWLQELTEMDYEIVHIGGMINILPDHLSRCFATPDRQPPLTIDSNTGVAEKTSPLYQVALVAQPQADIHPSNTDLKTPAEGDRKDILHRAHLIGHEATDILVNRVRLQGFNWPSLRADAHKMVNQCIECARHAIRKYGYQPLQSIEAELPMDHLQMDLASGLATTPGGNNIILVVVDVATRFVWLFALENKSAQSVANALFSLFCNVGTCKILQSDNGTEFVARVIDELTKVAGIDHRLISAYSPRSNGLVERQVQVVKKTIRKLVQDKPDWDAYLPAIQLAINTKITKLTGSTPFSLFYGRRWNGFRDYTEASLDPADPDALQNRIDFMHEVVFPSVGKRVSALNAKTRARYNSKHRVKDAIPKGSYVMVSDPLKKNKMSPSWVGPFKVLRRNRGGAYLLLDNDGELLDKPVPQGRLRIIDRDPTALDSDTYVVDRIMDHRDSKDGKDTEYLVKWKGYSSAGNTWQKYEDFYDTDCIRSYWERQSKKPINVKDVVSRGKTRGGAFVRIPLPEVKPTRLPEASESDAAPAPIYDGVPRDRPTLALSTRTRNDEADPSPPQELRPISAQPAVIRRRPQRSLQERLRDAFGSDTESSSQSDEDPSDATGPRRSKRLRRN